MEYKCVLIGASGVGKTSFVNRHVTGKFSNRYKPTDRVKVTSLVFHTREGDIKFNIWEIAGNHKYQETRAALMKDADCAILMMDLQNKESAVTLQAMYEHILKICPNIPMVLSGNKHQPEVNRLNPSDCEIPYIALNVKRNFNITKPFLCLAEQLLECPGLEFIDNQSLVDKHNLKFISMNTEENCDNVTCYDFSKCCNNMNISYK